MVGTSKILCLENLLIQKNNTKKAKILKTTQGDIHMKFNEERDIGIKITQYESLSKCINTIRKHRNESIGVIKSEIESTDFIFVCDFTDTPSLNQMLKCYDDLTKIGCTLTIQEQTRMISREILTNLLQMHKEIHEETLAVIEAEVDDDDEI